MSDIAAAVARVLARANGHAVPIVEQCMLAPDPDEVFGIAPVRVVSEQRVQAIAFGGLGRPPHIVTIWNPLSRESGELEPFADALDAFLMRALSEERLPRLWLPHGAALEIVDLLGQRYRTNRNASAKLQRMGWQCRAIAEEAKYSDQQAVAVAGDLLRAHVVTGQSVVEDHHLAALLAWINPPPGVDPVAEAARASLAPAAAMLERAVDDEVEHLRVVAKRAGRAEVRRARRQIEGHLRRGAEWEWGLLQRAHSAFWGLGLPSADVDGLVRASKERLKYALSKDLSPPSGPHSLSNLLYGYELAMERTEDALVRSDDTLRERARRRGKAMMADVIAVDQPRPGQHPCTLTLRTDQPVLRVRRGTSLQTLNAKVIGRVRAINEDAAGNTIIELRLERGVQRRWRPNVGESRDWVDSVFKDMTYQRKEINKELKRSAPTLVYGGGRMLPSPRPVPAGSLVAIAERLRRP